MEWAINEEKLNKLAEFVGSDDYKPIGKRDTMFKSVIPFFEALGYTVNNRYFNRTVKGKPHMIVDLEFNFGELVAQVVDFESDYSEIEEQLLENLKGKYFFAGVLTDGVTYKMYFVDIYRDSDNYIYEHTLSLLDLKPEDLEFCGFCTIQGIQNNACIIKVRHDLIKERCSKLLESLLDGDAENVIYEQILKGAGIENNACYMDVAREEFTEQLKERLTH